MATSEKILQLERGIVCNMERDIRQMIVQEKKAREVELHREGMIRKYGELEARKKQECEVRLEEAAARVAEAKVRQQQREEHLETERQIVIAVDLEKRARAKEKQERIAAEREAVRLQTAAEAKAKQDYIRQVMEQQECLHEERKQQVSARIQAGQARCEQRQIHAKIEVEEKQQQRAQKDHKTALKRESHRQYEAEMKQQAEDHLKRKMQQSAELQAKKAAELRNLELVKDKFVAKKRVMIQMMEEATRTGDMFKVNEALQELKEHQAQMAERAHKEWVEKSGTSPRRRQVQSGSPSSAGPSSPVSPQQPGFLTRRSIRSASVNSPGSPLSPAQAFSPERTQSPKRGSPRGFSPGPRKDIPHPGAHYDHLMGLFRKKMYSSPKDNDDRYSP